MNGNHISLTGNLTREPEYRVAPSGHGFTRGSLAVNRSRKQGDEWVEETSFVDFSVLDDQMAQNVAELQQGDRVTVTGWLQQRTVEQEDGTKRSFFSVVADDVAVSLRWATVSIHKNDKKADPTAPKSGRKDFFGGDDPF